MVFRIWFHASLGLYGQNHFYTFSICVSTHIALVNLHVCGVAPLHKRLSQWVPVPPLVALWQLLVLKNIDFGIILGPLWRLWAVDDFVHL